ncbi:MAG: ferrous iron transport protein B [Desulforhopalus sp.]|jgi:ferrous iron transport protein B
MNEIRIGVVGNPNCGKTTLFNSLTGAKQRVGNWPGVTVDRKEGHYQNNGTKVHVVDTPGIYSLAATSLDEEVTRDFVLSGEADLIVNIVDASNLERNLYLTSQLLEMRVPILLVLNMMDMAGERQLKIDVAGLQKRLGCPVVSMVAAKDQGLDNLKSAIQILGADPRLPMANVNYPEIIEQPRVELSHLLTTLATAKVIDAKWLALKLLEGDEVVEMMVEPVIVARARGFQQQIEESEDEDADILIASARYGFISELIDKVVERTGQMGATLSDKIDNIVLSRLFGVPIFFLAMYMMFMFTINLGGAFIDFFDQLTGTIFVDGLATLMAYVSAPDWLITVVAGGIGGGIQTMATFIPPIGFMFLFLSFLEDSGYMARAAFVMDRFMRFIGLPGKAFVPMLVGFGCNVPAIMATRTLESDRDRKLTIMMNPFMSCGARLPVYALFAAAFFPVGGQNLVFLLYLIGIGFAVVTGLILKKTVLQGEITPFVMELPPYHLPTLKSVLLRAYDRLTAFLFKAGKVLIPVIMILSFLNSLGTDGTFGNEDSEKSALASISKTITPVLYPLGVTSENWPATVGVFTGIFAKEAVVGTLDALYAGIDTQVDGSNEEEENSYSFVAGIKEAFLTIPANLMDLAGTITDPLGLSVGDISDTGTAAEAQEVSEATFGSMVNLFGSKSAAFAYLLFILLYFPCSAAIAAIYRETNLGWTAFAGFWTTFLAYVASTGFYQIVNFMSHPGYSMLVLGVDILGVAAVIMVLQALSLRTKKPGAVVNAVSA